MVRLECHNREEDTDLDQHEVKVPVLVLQQVLIVAVLAHHGELGLRLDLLDRDLKLAELRA